MRRLILEADVGEFARISGDKTVEKIRSFETLLFIRQDKDEIPRFSWRPMISRIAELRDEVI